MAFPAGTTPLSVRHCCSAAHRRCFGLTGRILLVLLFVLAACTGFLRTASAQEVEPDAAAPTRDLLFEAALPDRARSPLLAHQCKRILIFSCDLIALCNVLRRNAHMDFVERIGERTDHGVDHNRVAHLLAKTRRRHNVGCAAHHFSSATDCNFTITKHDGLCG